MFGAEPQLMARDVDDRVFRHIVALNDDFKADFRRHGQSIYENPSPGNIAGGLTTPEEKSLGAIQKGGAAPVTDKLRYGDPATPRGGRLSLTHAPCNAGVSSTALGASGASLLVYSPCLSTLHRLP